MTDLIRTFEVGGFRALADLRVNGFGKVNLVTGKNNSGKSSLLEAIRILVTGARRKQSMTSSITARSLVPRVMQSAFIPQLIWSHFAISSTDFLT